MTLWETLLPQSPPVPVRARVVRFPGGHVGPLHAESYDARARRQKDKQNERDRVRRAVERLHERTRDYGRRQR